MNSAQSPHIPAPGQKPGWKDIAWLARYCARGLCELVRARIVFARLRAKAIPERNRASKSAADPTTTITPAALARITYVLPRLSDRLPWRSDCLVQAIAGQDWLSALGAASEIQIGVEHPKDGDFGAHAWLLYNDKEHGEHIVTGGDIDQYHLILSDTRLADSRLDGDSQAENVGESGESGRN
jgi:hypothetical protein